MITFLFSDNFQLSDMFTVLRDDDICFHGDWGFASTGSQVSHIHPTNLSSHWFTATPNPANSIFKPFVFCENSAGSPHTISPDYGDEVGENGGSCAEIAHINVWFYH